MIPFVKIHHDCVPLFRRHGCQSSFRFGLGFRFLIEVEIFLDEHRAVTNIDVPVNGPIIIGHLDRFAQSFWNGGGG